ncbi:MAG: TauD/TfdA dioxygenase family protein [Alphaproteobacteria bacterium]
MDPRITPLTDQIGARIDDIDVSAGIDAAHAEILRRALVDHLVLVFPAQNLGEDAHMRFCRLFGEVGRHLRPDDIRTRDGNRNPAVMMVTNERRDGAAVGYLPDGEIMFHTDSCFKDIPQRAVSLYGIETTETGGETIFVNACRLYETLPADLRDRLYGRTAVNTYEFGVTVKTVETFDRSRWPHARHPVIAKDARDGRSYLYANELMTEEIDGLDPAESRAVLDRLFEHIRCSPDRYVHRWSPGDLVLWDNRRAPHARTDFPSDQRRSLRRIPIDGDVPVVAASPEPLEAVS